MGPRLFAIAILAGLVCAPAGYAAAQEQPLPDPVPSGTQDQPPRPPSPAEPDPEFSSRQRQAIRGCPPDQQCNSDLDRGLREFELETFPKRGSDSPWIENDDPDGHNAVRRGGKSGDSAPGRAIRRATGKLKPSELRPDLPWLDKLALPDVPFRWDSRIIQYLEFYKNDERGRRLMESWLSAQGRFRKLIAGQLRKAKLPADLIYVAMIESSYDPSEYSRVGASGLWQFMPAGGRIYGLDQDRWVDERNDPIKSTKAAVVYLADLYQRFGDWELALAAYNAGYGAVLRAMAKYNTNDFWQLLEYENALPWESSVYVPKAIACAIVGHNRDLFGFGDVQAQPTFAYDTVTVPTSVTLAVIARASGTTTEAIQRLNTHIRQGRTPPGKTRFAVRIPKGRAGQFAEKFPELRGDWDRHDAYVVRHGERFEDIATIHGLSSSKLRELNGVSSEAEITGGTVIVVPRVSEDDKKKNLAKADKDLYRSGVVPNDDGDDLLLVAVPDPTTRIKGKRQVFYRVVSGDTQFRIAQAFGVSRQDLADWNGLDPDAHLTARMVVQVWIDKRLDPAERRIQVLDAARLRIVKSGSPEHMELAEQRIGRKRVIYEARKRESFEQIGKKFGLSARDVARINRRPYNTVLEAGETILIYQVVDAKASDRAAKQARQKGRSTAKAPQRGRGKSAPKKRR